MSDHFDLKAYLKRQRNAVDAALAIHLRHFCLSDRMYQPVAYAVSAGGKRVRPILCLASCEAVGGDLTVVMPVACALEMIHTYSLIHDDLPALDNDDMRRGNPTCHKQFDEATAILAGDALLTMAFEVISEAASNSSDQAAGKWLRVFGIISESAGCRGMIEGQARDLAFEGTRIDQAELEALHRLKTGAMIRASIHTGSLLGNATQDQTDRLNVYADNIGLAFQVVDDILNIKGDPSKLGKAVGTDMIRGKNTYPALMGLERAEAYARQLIDQALQSISPFDRKADPLRAIARYILHRDH